MRYIQPPKGANFLKNIHEYHWRQCRKTGNLTFTVGGRLHIQLGKLALFPKVSSITNGMIQQLYLCVNTQQCFKHRCIKRLEQSVYSSIILNNPSLETFQMSISSRMETNYDMFIYQDIVYFIYIFYISVYLKFHCNKVSK